MCKSCAIFPKGVCWKKQFTFPFPSKEESMEGDGTFKGRFVDVSVRTRRERTGEQGSIRVPAIGTPATVTLNMVYPKSDNDSCNPPFGPPKD
jgi:hypothetical protein